MKWLEDASNPALSMAYGALFNTDVSTIDDSWLDTLSIGDTLKNYRISTKKNTVIHDLVIKELGLTTLNADILAEPVDPLLLMSRDSLLNLLSLLGTIQFKTLILHTILANEVRILKSNIGEDNYRFAINFARLYTMPDVKNRDALEALFKIEPLKALHCAGAQTLFSLIKLPHPILAQRIQYTLPHYMAEHISNDHLTINSPQHMINNRLRNHVVKIAKDNAIPCYHLLA